MLTENVVQVNIRELLEHNVLAHGGKQVVAVLLFGLQFLSEDFLDPHYVVQLGHLLRDFVQTLHALF